MTTTRFEQHRKAMAWWLFAVCALTFGMVVLGGLTRLTSSGLSMVEWKPVVGILPPMGAEAWLAEFQKYQQFPEYQKVNQGMTLDQFKEIFWFEYSHRLLGRLIGLVFFVPFTWFLAWRAIPRSLVPRLAGLFALGGLQGLVGWWMVKSGLVDRPDVSHYRLTVHLSMAFALLAALTWTGLDLGRAVARDDSPRAWPTAARWAALLLGCAFVTAMSGAMVAGSNAGFAWNTFPLMAGHLVPPGLLQLEPWYLNPLENLLTMQFQHRVAALSLATAVVVFRLRMRRHTVPGMARRSLDATVAAVLLQVTLGISTLLSVVWIPLASAHQAGALALLLCLTWTTWELRHAPRARPENP